MSVSEGEISDIAPHQEGLLYLAVHRLPRQLPLIWILGDTVRQVQRPPSVGKMISKHYHVSQKWDNTHPRRQISNKLSPTHLLGVRGPRPPPSLPENISIMSRRKKLSNAENLLTLCLLWCLSEWEADIRSTWEWKYNRALKTNMYFSPPILTISYLYRLFIFYFNVSEVFHSAPFQLKSQFLFPFNVAVFVLQRFIISEMYWKLPAKKLWEFCNGFCSDWNFPGLLQCFGGFRV